MPTPQLPKRLSWTVAEQWVSLCASSLVFQPESGYARAVPISQQCSGSPTDTHIHSCLKTFSVSTKAQPVPAFWLAGRCTMLQSFTALLLHTGGTEIGCCRFPYGERARGAALRVWWLQVSSQLHAQYSGDVPVWWLLGWLLMNDLFHFGFV